LDLSRVKGGPTVDFIDKICIALEFPEYSPTLTLSRDWGAQGL